MPGLQEERADPESRFAETQAEMNKAPNKIIGANAGGPSRFPNRTLWAARIAQLWRWP